MAHLSISRTAERRKRRIAAALSVFLEMYTAVSTLVLLMASVASTTEDFERTSEGIGETMEGNEDENPVDLQDDDFSSFTPARTSSVRGMSSTKRKRKYIYTSEPITADSLLGAAMMLSEKLESVGDKISRSLGTELTIRQKIEQLDSKLSEIEGLTHDDKLMALIKLPEYSNQMLVFFSLAPDERLEWVRRFLATY